MAAPIRRNIRASCRTLCCLASIRHRFFYSTRSILQTRSLSTRIEDEEISQNNSIITRDSRVDSVVAEQLEKRVASGDMEHVRYRNHPGIMRRKYTRLPSRLLKAIKIVLEKYPVEKEKVEKLATYLQARIPPASDLAVQRKASEYERKLIEKDPHMFDDLVGADLEIAESKLRNRVIKQMRKNFYHWKPMHYDAYTSIIYLLARLSSDYSVIMQCFIEISMRDPDLKPTSVYHHGSKVGASVWASSKVWSTIGEHYCVDESSDMNTVARLLLQDGNEQEQVLSISGVYFRQFQPSGTQNQFSMVVCPYMLMEQPSQNDRFQLLFNMWQMTQAYLVLIELGTTAGFSLINEAREFLLNLHEFRKDQRPEEDASQYEGHVFAPCPHDAHCPKVLEQNQPCIAQCNHREVNYESSKQTHDKQKKHARYSYVILKKGPRPNDSEWPRMLKQVMAKRHTHCYMCLPSAKLQHVVITKGKFDKHVYGCARYTYQGDLFPISLSPTPPPSASSKDTDS